MVRLRYIANLNKVGKVPWAANPISNYLDNYWAPSGLRRCALNFLLTRD